jgi:hypothetical protein
MTSAASAIEAAPRRKSSGALILYLAVGFIGAWTVWITCALVARSGTPGSALVPAVIAGSFAPFLASGLALGASSALAAAVLYRLAPVGSRRPAAEPA